MCKHNWVLILLFLHSSSLINTIIIIINTVGHRNVFLFLE